MMMMDFYRRAVHNAHQFRANRESAFTSMLGEVRTKVEQASMNRRSVVYRVPATVTGSVTPYSVREARDWLMATLRRQGFTVKPLLGDTLWVYWGDDYSELQRKDVARGATSLDEAVRLIDETLR